MIYFEWDEKKAASNLEKHGLAFEDAALIFQDEFRLTQEDSVADGELRWRTVGLAAGITVLLVIHLEESDDQDIFVRIISARKALEHERMDYERNRSQNIG
ncbi:MAG: BrnT family toxin [Acidobacteriaceae bacterium]|nr:BrnT family toxin [Acidobacteriaceae bacterium]